MGDLGERKDRAKVSKIRPVYKLSIKHWHVESFFNIIDEELEDLLEEDICHKLADKYLISMVFMYFLRADFRPEEFTRFNFISALCLAHDMEEEDDDNRADLLLFTGPDDTPWSRNALHERRLYIFKRMKYRAVVSRACCDALMRVANPKHSVWQRERYAVHSGANRFYHRVGTIIQKIVDEIQRIEGQTQVDLVWNAVNTIIETTKEAKISRR